MKTQGKGCNCPHYSLEKFFACSPNSVSTCSSPDSLIRPLALSSGLPPVWDWVRGPSCTVVALY
uniref:Uncharacterized protein n=1 Tax=Arundo donax TaxID=35708 RepID=A0A0A9HAT4_ARUDO